MGSLRGHHAQDIYDAYDEYDDIHSHFERKSQSQPASSPTSEPEWTPHALRRSQPSESFKCHNCKAFIGMPLTGGRHRNHCPILSLVVARRPQDAGRPGQRLPLADGAGRRPCTPQWRAGRRSPLPWLRHRSPLPRCRRRQPVAADEAAAGHPRRHRIRRNRETNWSSIVLALNPSQHPEWEGSTGSFTQ